VPGRGDDQRLTPAASACSRAEQHRRDDRDPIPSAVGHPPGRDDDGVEEPVPELVAQPAEVTDVVVVHVNRFSRARVGIQASRLEVDVRCSIDVRWGASAGLPAWLS
jgi:hypothetical protein